MAIVEIAKNYSALIDDIDVELISQHRWRVHLTRGREIPRAMATINGKRRYEYMHRLIMQPKPDEFIFHRDGDYFNNRRANLLTQPLSQRSAARPKPKKGGVLFIRGKWVGRISFKYKTYDLRACDDEKEARKARNYLAWRLRGQITRLKESDFEHFDPHLLTPSIYKLFDIEALD